MLLLFPETRKTMPTITAAMTTTMIAVTDLLAALLLLRLGGQPGLPGRALAGSLVAGHGPRPYPIPGTASDRPPGSAPSRAAPETAGGGSRGRAGRAQSVASSDATGRPEIRGHLGRRRRPDPCRGRPHRPHPRARAPRWWPWSAPWARRPTTSSTWPTRSAPPSRPASTTCSSAPGSASPCRCWSWPWPTSEWTPPRSPGARSASSPTTTTPGPRSGRSRATASVRRWPPGRCPSWRGSRGSRPPARSPRWAGAGPTPPPWRWLPSSTPTSARSTPTSPGCSRRTPGSCPRRTGSTGSPSRRCSRWRPPAGGC